MIEATSATVRNLTSLSGVSPAAICFSLFRTEPSAPGRIQRISHLRPQRKSCAEKGNPGAGQPLGHRPGKSP